MAVVRTIRSETDIKDGVTALARACPHLARVHATPAIRRCV
jgi:hypothetical protein